SGAARDPRMRIVGGVRRRLAAVMDGARRPIELITAVLMSMAAPPIVYYGDEIGMGDNIHLGDRNGVRTPMQWSADRNAGFSAAEATQLYLPAITDPVYNYQAVNVAAQDKLPSSLLNTTRKLIAARKRSAVFGRGTIEFLRPRNQSVLAYLRRWQDDAVLVVVNLSSRPQPAELDLATLEGMTPVEMLGDTRFPPIRRDPYFLALGPHDFYWFRLKGLVPRPIRYGIEESAI